MSNQEYEYKVTADGFIDSAVIRDPSEAGDEFRRARKHAGPGESVTLLRRPVAPWEVVEVAKGGKP